jgi:hypothetical protein
MTNSEDKPPPAVGAYWIKEEDYPALRQLFDDGEKMPPSWKEWLKMAEEMEQGLKDTSCYVFTSTPPHSRIGAPPMAQARAGRTQKIRRGGGNREIWPTGLISTASQH